MIVSAAPPSLPTSLHVTGSARTSHSRSRRCAPSRNHCNSATIYPRHEPSERGDGTRSSQLLGFHNSACLQGGATRISCDPPAVARRNSPKRQVDAPRCLRASGAIRAAIDAFVIGFQDTLLKPSSDSLLEPAAEALRTTSLPFYVLTSSSSSSSSLSPADVSAFLKRDAGVDIPEDSPRIITVAEEGEGKLAALLTVRVQCLPSPHCTCCHVVPCHVIPCHAMCHHPIPGHAIAFLSIPPLATHAGELNSRPLAHKTANTMHYMDSNVAAFRS
ncbi:unnamed protein product [Closterium sp. NIES-54]